MLSWNMALFNLEDRYQRFGECYRRRLQGRIRLTSVQNVGTKLDDVIPERTVIGSAL